MDYMRILTIDEYLATVQATFAPEKACGRKAILQYTFSGRDTGECYVIVEGGTVRVGRGRHPSPDVSVTTDFDLWMRVLAYKVDGLIAYQEGQFTVEGDMELLMDSDTWFTR